MKNKKELVAISSVVAGVILTTTKFIVGVLTGSMGILSEAVHSLLDLAAAVMTFFAVKVGDKPADEDHNYGHGKIESISALIETGLLFITGFWIIYESVHKLIVGDIEVKATWYAFVVVVLSMIIDISRSRALKKIAKETNSQALEADALHFSSDILSSGVVLLGLVFILFGIRGADTIAAMGVSIFVFLAAYRLGKKTIDVLVDGTPSGVLEKIKEIVKKIDYIIDIERIRVRHLGSNLSIELIIVVNHKLSIDKVHEISQNIEVEIKKEIKEADIVINIKPVKSNDETIVESIRALALKNGFSVHDVIVDNLDNKQYISYDLELPDDLTIKEAHDIATNFEKSIKNEVEDNTELNSHIEPLKKHAILSSNITKEEQKRVKDAISEIDKTIEEICEPHNILIRRIEEKLFVSFHCLAQHNISLEKIHDITMKFEYLLKEKVSEIKRVVIHVESKE